MAYAVKVAPCVEKIYLDVEKARSHAQKVNFYVEKGYHVEKPISGAHFKRR